MALNIITGPGGIERGYDRLLTWSSILSASRVVLCVKTIVPRKPLSIIREPSGLGRGYGRSQHGPQYYQRTE
jgi:hypothetical protein